MKAVLKYIAKKYAVSMLNDLLSQKKTDVESFTKTTIIWICRLESMLAMLKKVNERVSDGEIDNQELDDSIGEIKEFIETF